MPSEIVDPDHTDRPDIDTVSVAHSFRFFDDVRDEQEFRSFQELWTLFRQLQLHDKAAVSNAGQSRADMLAWRSSHSPLTYKELPRPHTGSGETVEKERQEKEIERLREEVNRLTMQNELLQTRVAEQRRSLARESRHSDKFQSGMGDIVEQNSRLLKMQDKYLALLSERGRANDALAMKMAAVEDGHLRMHEVYEGQVQHVGESTVVVTYNVGGDRLIEQTYEKKQFKDERLPAVGTCLRVLVFVIEYEPKPPPCDSESESLPRDEPSHRKPPTGPIEF